MLERIPVTLLILATVVLAACASMEQRQRTVYSAATQVDGDMGIQRAYTGSVLRVATLNIAHGRKSSISQFLVQQNTFKQNLDDIADVLKQYRPHVVALQEADAASLWSGNFDHVNYLASNAGYPWRVHAKNSESWFYSYGTALLSVSPPSETIKHTFEPSPPTLDKGFTLAQIEWLTADGERPREVDIISVHLDFSRQSVREKQVAEILEILSTRSNPVIIMGDFNSEWLAEVSVIKELATQSRFVTYEPENGNYFSYKNKRLDWILITNDMEFVKYQVLPDTLSDHAMVVADIRFRE